MSDTKLQIKNSLNQRYINQLKSLYKQEATIRIEIKFVERKINEKQSYVSLRNFQNYEVNWLLKVLKGNLITNKDRIQMVREKLVIC